MRKVRLGSALLGTGAIVAAFAVERDARACGGEFVPPNQVETVATDHRMILALSQDTTTLYDEIEFTGSASSFAWVLPIKGTATVALSADLLFASLDQLTATQVVEPPTNCPPPPDCGEDFNGAAAPTATKAALDAGVAGGGVTVLSQAQVGPYDTVQLQSTDPTALQTWLTAHGFAIPSDEASVVSGYVAEGFDFLAMKLAPGQGVTAMQPVRVTTQGASPVLPLRMVSVGTGATTGITLWVVASGRYQPQNFPSFIIQDSQLAWDWNTGTSNYDSVRTSEEAQYGGRGWQVESSLDINEQSLEQLVQNATEFGGPVTGGYTAIGDGGTTDGGDDEEDAGAVDAGAGASDGGYQSVAAVEQDDFSALFAGGSNGVVRVTRIRSDIAHTALTADLTLEASSDQTELTNVYNTTNQIGEPLCPVYNESCEVTGNAPLPQAQAAAAALAAGGGSSGGGAGCSTAPSYAPTELGFLALGSFLALGVVRSRRRRPAR